MSKNIWAGLLILLKEFPSVKNCGFYEVRCSDLRLGAKCPVVKLEVTHILLLSKHSSFIGFNTLLWELFRKAHVISVGSFVFISCIEVSWLLVSRKGKTGFQGEGVLSIFLFPSFFLSFFLWLRTMGIVSVVQAVSLVVGDSAQCCSLQFFLEIIRQLKLASWLTPQKTISGQVSRKQS